MRNYPPQSWRPHGHARRGLMLLRLGCLLGPLLLNTAQAAPPFRILCSFYPIYVMALNIAGDVPDVSVECMTESVVGCLHDYELTPRDLKRFGHADVFIANGAGMESFLEKALNQVPTLRVIEAAAGIPLLEGDNPHVWVSISGAMQETRNIAAGLESADPVHASAYARNAQIYLTRLDELRTRMHAALDHVKHRKIVTLHEAFPYFAKEFGLQIAGVVEREPGADPSAGELRRTIDTIRASGVTAIFAEPQYSARAMEVVQREAGIPVRILDPAVTGPREPAQARGAYLQAMEKNLIVLREALN